MPTYEYQCPRCGLFETVQSMKDDPLQTCPTCGSAVRRRVGRNVTVVYNTSGFHNTDYRSEEYKAKAKKESESLSPASASPPSSDRKDGPSQSRTGEGAAPPPPTPKTAGGNPSPREEAGSDAA